MKCPVCKDPDLVMSDRQGIEIDYCPQCRGVWLDRGELDKIIERSAADVAPPPPPPPTSSGDYPRRKYDDDYRHGGYKRHKKKNLLGEIFDF